MANQLSRTVRARHVFRTDKNGTPKEKTFPRNIWNKLPKIHQWVDGQKYEHEKMGWVEIANTPAPEPLKKSAPKKDAEPLQPVKSTEPSTGGGVLGLG